MVEIVRGAESGRGGLRGLQTCGHVTCPRCGGLIAARERERLTALTTGHLERGGGVYTAIRTARHTRRDRLADLMDAIDKGRKASMSGRAWRRLRDEYGVVGYTWHRETTWTPSGGWHPHLHLTLFTETPLSDEEREGLDATLFSLYERAMEGYYVEHEANGLEEVRSGEGIAAYVAKSVALEATMGMEKNGGLTPFDMLFNYTQTGDMAEMRRFQVWEGAMTGRRWRQWSRGLAAMYGIDEPAEEEDRTAAEEDAADVEGDAATETVATVEPDVWDELVARGLVSPILCLVEERRDEEVHRILDAVRSDLVADRLTRSRTREAP